MLNETVNDSVGVASTVTLKLPWPVLPALSAAPPRTVAELSANVLPEAGEQLTVGCAGATASTAEAENVTTAGRGPVASSVMLGGTINVGGVVYSTFTVKLSWPMLQGMSVAV